MKEDENLEAYSREIEIVRKAKEVIETNKSEKNAALESLIEVTKGFEKFINETAKITRVTDMLQNKLQKSYTRIEEQQEEMKKLNKDLENKNELLNEANLVKDKFFSIIAHDLRGAIGNIAVVLEEMTDSESCFDEKDRLEMLRMLTKSSKNTYSLLENLLEWARVQKNDMKFRPSNISIYELVMEILGVIGPIANKKQIEIEVELNKELEIYADKNMILTVIRNLISNAVKFTKVSGKIKIKEENSDAFYQLFIVDNGIGMDNEKIGKLFKISENISEKGTSGEKGTGLGLILTKEFVDKHNGNIVVRSEVNKGTEFRIVLPKL